MDSGFSDFFSQIPSIFIVMFCGSGVLLLVVLGSIFRARGKQRAAAVQPAGAAVYNSYSDFGDLPDLDEIISTQTSAQPSTASVQSAPKARPNGAYTVALAEGESVEVVEVLTVLRDVGDGGLIIQIGDKAYRNPPAYADADFKRRLNNTLRDLRDAPQAAAKSSTVEAVVADEMDTPPLSADLPSDVPPVAAAPPPPPAAARFNPYEPAPGDLPKFRMPDGPPVKPKRGKRPEPEPIPEINIASAIEAFLQHKLVRTPEYSRRSIHVVPAPHGAVKIEVDGTFYDSVAEIEDVPVRQFLSSTIEEWQSRQ